MKATTLQSRLPITSEDIIKQLVGPHEDWDNPEILVYQFTHCARFNDATVVVDFNKGTLYIVDDEGLVTETYFIKAELIPVTDVEP